uniref:Nucleolar protein 11 C-terminal domain-containing protein n=1 Tax=Ciona savignyi TaxID=51511 RepID=H2ZG41_CIOSA
MCHHTISSLPLSTKIYTTGHNLYVVDQHSVSVVQFTTHPVTLSSVIRKQAAPVTTPLEAIYWSADENKVCNEGSESMESTEALLRCTNERQATKYWEEMWLAKSDSQRHRLCCSTFMRELFTNLTDSKLPWMPHLLEKIVKSGHISSSVSPNLIRVILEHKEWKLLRTCVKLLCDISESDVVLCLDSLLGDDLMGNLQEDIIVDILALPYTEDLLKNEVRKLPFLKSVQLLKFLRTKLNISASLSDCLPDYDQVASWIGLLLDAHSTSIITTPHVWPLLTELQSTILLQTELFSELQKIDVLLNQINQPCNFNKNSNIFEYSVHRMVL